MKRLKAGIIGLGVGEKHIEGYQKHPDCEVVALCDFSEKKLSMVKQKYPGMKSTGNADEILEDPGIDVVSIASYDNYHYEQIIKAVKNDKHVFVEKPLCQFEKDAIHIRSLLNEKKHIKMSSNLILRKSPRFIALKKMISSGKLGRIFYLEGDYNYGRIHKITDGWRGKIDFYSVVYGGGVHIIDLIRWLTGEWVEEVSAYGNNIATRGSNFNNNDIVAGILKFKSGLVGKVTSNFGCVFPHFHGLSFYGTSGTFVNGMDCGFHYGSRDPDRPVEKMYDAYPGTHKGDLLYDFVDSILHNREAEVSSEDIFHSMSVCFAIEKSAQQGKPVSVNYI